MPSIQEILNNIKKNNSQGSKYNTNFLKKTATTTNVLATATNEKNPYLKRSELNQATDGILKGVTSTNALGSTITGVTDTLSNVIETKDPNTLTLSNTVKRTGQGAALGTMIAPGIGTAIGAGSGFILGGIEGGMMKDKALKERKRQRQQQINKARQQMKRVSGHFNNSLISNRQSYVSLKNGGKLCNCKEDGIDTDVFKSFTKADIKTLQKHIGTTQDGIYKIQDKYKMKENAHSLNVRLKDYLELDPDLKIAMKTTLIT